MDVTPFLALRTAPEVLLDRAKADPKRIRFVVPGQPSVTYDEFCLAMRAVCAYLSTARAGGATPLAAKDRAVVFAPNSVEWAVAALGIQGAQGCLVPLYPASTPAQAAYVIAHSDARVVFVDSDALFEKAIRALTELDPSLPLPLLVTMPSVSESNATGPIAIGSDRKAQVVRWRDLIAEGLRLEAAEPARIEALIRSTSLDAPGTMLYTSGTTGNPKGVPLTHRNVGANGADWLRCNAPVVREFATDLLWLPMSHIFGFGEMCIGNTLGWTSTMVDPFQAIKEVARVKPNVFFSVPSHWEKLAEPALREDDPNERKRVLLERTGGALEFCLSGGAGLKREIKELFHEAGILIVEGYGLTEASPTLTLNRPDAFRFDSVGKPLPSVELKLAEDGEILARGPNVFHGYHKDMAATREVLTEDGWLKTGDVGEWTDDGFLKIIDRKKDILVTAGGKNVPPANIELRFAGDPEVAHVVVYGDGKKYLVLGVWTNGKVEEDKIAEKVATVNAELASYETIKRFVILQEPLTVENGLLTSSFKVRRKAVIKHFLAQFEALYT
jgi:long-chain acyl-CoA synthetase